MLSLLLLLLLLGTMKGGESVDVVEWNQDWRPSPYDEESSRVGNMLAGSSEDLETALLNSLAALILAHTLEQREVTALSFEM